MMTAHTGVGHGLYKATQRWFLQYFGQKGGRYFLMALSLCSIMVSVDSLAVTNESAMLSLHFANRLERLPQQIPVENVVSTPSKGMLVLLDAPPAPQREPYVRVDIGNKYTDLINIFASRYQHDVALVKAIIFVESNFNPVAESEKGALGLMQIMPSTASDLGLKDPARQLLDPQINIEIGCRHLRRLMDKFALDAQLALAAYNAGEGAVARYGNTIPPFEETRNYVSRVMAAMRDIKNVSQ